MSEVNLKVRLLAHTPDIEKIVASAAKLCYSPTGIDELLEGLTDEKAEKFIDKLMSIGHESPIEHASFTFAIEGVSRVLTHQLVRHRIASYSQKSQRYVVEGQFEYIVPPQIGNNQFSRLAFIEAMESSQATYDAIIDELLYGMCHHYLVDNKIYSEDCQQWEPSLMFEKTKEQSKKRFSAFEKKAIEDARFVLPNACETKIIMTMNARSLLHLFNERCCDRAQWEIRAMANDMLRLTQEVAPTLFKYAGAKCVRGKCPEGVMSCGNPKTIQIK